MSVLNVMGIASTPAMRIYDKRAIGNHVGRHWEDIEQMGGVSPEASAAGQARSHICSSRREREQS